MKQKPWFVYALVTTIFWGIWGALIEITEKNGFPATLGYSVWALTMIFPAFIALRMNHWKFEHDFRSVILGCLIGLTGAGGQLLLFQTLREGPAYLVFPFISLSPVITVVLSYIFLKERSTKKGWLGIITALVAIPLLSFQPPQNSSVSGGMWILFSLIVLLAWGLQAYIMKFANLTMKAESIFIYMTITGLVLIPFAIWMTDFSKEINYGFSGPYLAAVIQILNSIGALTLVYAFRYGKAIIVSPMTNAIAPVITIIISLSIYGVVPHPITLAGIGIAFISILLMALDESSKE